MHTCKTLGLAALAVTVSALALPAAAEDLSGTRFDVHADYLWGHVQPSGFSDAGDTALTGYDSNSSGVGVDLRHDWQNDSTVFGVFGSFTTFSATGGASVAKTVTVEDTSGGGENTESKKAPRSVIETEGTTITEHHGFDTDLSWLAAVGGRFGTVVNENTLLYVQAGVASGRVKITETGDNATAVRDVSKAGYVAGVGAQWQMNERWSVGFSISHYDLGKVGFMPGAYEDGKLGIRGTVAAISLGVRL